MLNGCLEVALFVERFRNIDLFQQGLYILRFTVASTSRRLARPTEWLKTSCSDPLYSLKPPHCSESTGHIQSSVFLIRYSEEEAQLRELLRFRLESSSSDLETVLLTAELLYSDLDKDLTVDTIQKRLAGEVQFKPVAKVEIALTEPKAGILEPLALEFDDLHCCMVLGCFACVFYDYRYRPPDRGIDSSLLYQYMAKLIVTDRQGLPKPLAGAGETDHIYESIIRPQALAHELLRSYLCDVLNRYIPSAGKARHSDLPPPLSLPHYHRPGIPKSAKFSQAVSSHAAAEICEAVMSDVSYIGEQISGLLESLRELLAAYPLHCMSPLFERRLERLRNWSAGFVKRYNYGVAKVPSVGNSADQEASRGYIAREQRSLNVFSAGRHNGPIESVPGDPSQSPILFEDSYYTLDAAPPPKPPEDHSHRQGKKHLFVLVHGFHGKSLDLRLVKHAIMTYSTLATVLCAAANEDDSEIDLTEMGAKLAAEVRNYILEWLPGDSLGKISFVGYSMGGIVARAALPLLSEYSSHFHAFISFSAPHLGHVAENSLVGAGLWLLERVKKSQLLQQLLLNDHSALHQTALYRLSQAPGLDCFHHIVLCSSCQDKYVPRDSARIETTTALGIRPEKGQCCMEMATNILSRLSPERVLRVDVDFWDNSISLDAMTGRSAHLMFVTNAYFLRLFVYQYSELFS